MEVREGEVSGVQVGGLGVTDVLGGFDFLRCGVLGDLGIGVDDL